MGVTTHAKIRELIAGIHYGVNEAECSIQEIMMIKEALAKNLKDYVFHFMSDNREELNRMMGVLIEIANSDRNIISSDDLPRRIVEVVEPIQNPVLGEERPARSQMITALSVGDILTQNIQNMSNNTRVELSQLEYTLRNLEGFHKDLYEALLKPYKGVARGDFWASLRLVSGLNKEERVTLRKHFARITDALGCIARDSSIYGAENQEQLYAINAYLLNSLKQMGSALPQVKEAARLFLAYSPMQRDPLADMAVEGRVATVLSVKELLTQNTQNMANNTFVELGQLEMVLINLDDFHKDLYETLLKSYKGVARGDFWASLWLISGLNKEERVTLRKHFARITGALNCIARDPSIYKAGNQAQLHAINAYLLNSLKQMGSALPQVKEAACLFLAHSPVQRDPLEEIPVGAVEPQYHQSDILDAAEVARQSDAQIDRFGAQQPIQQPSSNQFAFFASANESHASVSGYSAPRPAWSESEG